MLFILIAIFLFCGAKVDIFSVTPSIYFPTSPFFRPIFNLCQENAPFLLKTPFEGKREYNPCFHSINVVLFMHIIQTSYFFTKFCLNFPAI